MVQRPRKNPGLTLILIGLIMLFPQLVKLDPGHIKTGQLIVLSLTLLFVAFGCYINFRKQKI